MHINLVAAQKAFEMWYEKDIGVHCSHLSEQLLILQKPHKLTSLAFPWEGWDVERRQKSLSDTAGGPSGRILDALVTWSEQSSASMLAYGLKRRI